MKMKTTYNLTSLPFKCNSQKVAMIFDTLTNLCNEISLKEERSDEKKIDDDDNKEIPDTVTDMVLDDNEEFPVEVKDILDEYHKAQKTLLEKLDGFLHKKTSYALKRKRNRSHMQKLPRDVRFKGQQWKSTNTYCSTRK